MLSLRHFSSAGQVRAQSGNMNFVTNINEYDDLSNFEVLQINILGCS
jgi:hypothetical protein